MKENYIAPSLSITKPQLLQFDAQEYTCKLILGGNADLTRLDFIESLEIGVITCYKGKNYLRNETTIPQIR